MPRKPSRPAGRYRGSCGSTCAYFLAVLDREQRVQRRLSEDIASFDEGLMRLMRQRSREPRARLVRRVILWDVLT